MQKDRVLKDTMANLISHYDLPGFGTDSNFPALQTVKNNNKIKDSNIMKKFIFFTLLFLHFFHPYLVALLRL